ncbi:ribose-phosphate pyrophosphokinase [Xenococcus sp. PCC 7305]|uniref:ribose-phosphate pyrophosphokinase n=1 Tax=Xenococcus sp. PCC 7305 TaxID=102125 RepID=UPI0002ACF902|nr:ribose-phosphate pyrophosphokinase [Xenococcus sp. PCC 7305]ELS04716.1 ribose-phosphate pyrophosphokinase [Xenococcus sp. PCC 7305]
MIQQPVISDSNRLRLFAGSANRPLAQEVARYLGIDLGPMIRKRFADGELYVQIQESIRGADVYLLQPCCNPVNDNLMELMILIDACRRASARQITAVIPYYGYARADRKTAGRESITAKLVANLIVKAGANKVLAMDLHSAQIQGYFDIPLDHVYGSPVLIDYLARKELSDLVVVSPDVGGVARARAFAKKLNDAPLAIIDKRRQAHNVAEVMNVIGDVKGKTAVLVDDMIDTAGTLLEGGKLLKKEGASKIYACATHPVFSGPAASRLSSGVFEEVIVTNTIPIPEEKQFEQLTVLSGASLLGEAIWRIHEDTSVSSMFR